MKPKISIKLIKKCHPINAFMGQKVYKKEWKDPQREKSKTMIMMTWSLSISALFQLFNKLSNLTPFAKIFIRINKSKKLKP